MPCGDGKDMKKNVSYILLCVCVPAAVLAGALIFEGRGYAWISLCVAVMACVPFFVRFEKKNTGTYETVLAAAMTALSVLGRIIFAPLPGFKPVTAMTVITAMYFGPEAGFMTGALSALISNFYFGQGPWTPFQMFCFGIIGFIAGIFAEKLKKSRIALAVYAILSGVMYSLLMDVWTVLWADGYFNISRYFAAVVSALGFTLIYAVSNVIFLLVLSKPFGKILARIKTKYMTR